LFDEIPPFLNLSKMDYVGGVVSKLKLPDMIFSCESWLCSMGFLAKVLSKIPSFTLAVSFQE